MSGVTLRAYLAHSYRKPADLIGLTQEELAKALAFSPHDMSGTDGWIEVGEVHISSVTLKPHDQMVADTVAALRQQVQNIRAESELKAARLENEIQKLLAIGCEVVA